MKSLNKDFLPVNVADDVYTKDEVTEINRR